MSKQRHGGLGRGLGALIPSAAPSDDHSSEPGLSGEVSAPAAVAQETAGQPNGPDTVAGDGLAPVPGAAFAELPIAGIRPNPRQPRQVFDEDAHGELTHSIREFGVLQPVVVRALPSDADGAWELVVGERRLRAAAAAGLTTIPAIVRSTADDAMLRDALLENVHRAQLNPLEEAAAYQQLLDEFGATHEELARRLGRSRPQVTNTIRLLQLSLPVQRRVAAGVLSAGHARALLSLDDADRQDDLAARIVAEGLSVRGTEELVALARRGEDVSGPKRRPRAPRISAPGLSELAEQLSDVLDTRVRLDIGRRKGKITVEFASIDDLERIITVIAPSLAERRAALGDQPDGAADPVEDGDGDPDRVGDAPADAAANDW
jgi:ParB family chromosome partitioning protein